MQSLPRYGSGTKHKNARGQMTWAQAECDLVEIEEQIENLADALADRNWDEAYLKAYAIEEIARRLQSAIPNS